MFSGITSILQEGKLLLLPSERLVAMHRAVGLVIVLHCRLRAALTVAVGHAMQISAPTKHCEAFPLCAGAPALGPPGAGQQQQQQVLQLQHSLQQAQQHQQHMAAMGLANQPSGPVQPPSMMSSLSGLGGAAAPPQLPFALPPPPVRPALFAPNVWRDAEPTWVPLKRGKKYVPRCSRACKQLRRMACDVIS